MQECKISIIMG